MNAKFRFDDGRAAIAATVAALAAAAMGIVAVTHTQSSESTTVGIEHLGLAMFSLALVAMVPAILRLGAGAGGAARIGARVAVTGQVVLAALATVSNVNGEDPSFFAAVAAPANLAILGGWITLAVVSARRGTVPVWLAVALPVSYIALLPASQIGGGILTAALWLLIARHLSAPAAARLRVQGA